MQSAKVETKFDSCPFKTALHFTTPGEGKSVSDPLMPLKHPFRELLDMWNMMNEQPAPSSEKHEPGPLDELDLWHWVYYTRQFPSTIRRDGVSPFWAFP